MVRRSKPSVGGSRSSLMSRLSQHWMVIGLVVIGAVAGGVVVTDSVSDVRAFAEAGKEMAANATDSDSTVLSLNETRTEELIHEKINEERNKRGLPMLDHDPELQTIASDYSTAMATTGFYNHTSPDGKTMQDRYEKAGYECRIPIDGNRYAIGAENINRVTAYQEVVGEDSYYAHTEEEVAAVVVQQWMNSTNHRKNILREYWNDEGIGVYVIEDPDGAGKKVYVTQNFC